MHVFTTIVQEIHHIIGLTLFGVDVVIENGTGRYNIKTKILKYVWKLSALYAKVKTCLFNSYRVAVVDVNA